MQCKRFTSPIFCSAGATDMLSPRSFSTYAKTQHCVSEIQIVFSISRYEFYDEAASEVMGL